MKNLDICYNLLGTKGSEDRYGQLVINSQEFGKKKTSALDASIRFSGRFPILQLPSLSSGAA
jgi:hypothetical protein